MPEPARWGERAPRATRSPGARPSWSPVDFLHAAREFLHARRAPRVVRMGSTGGLGARRAIHGRAPGVRMAHRAHHGPNGPHGREAQQTYMVGAGCGGGVGALVAARGAHAHDTSPKTYPCGPPACPPCSCVCYTA
jgi:nitrous oxide reductase accessory protein NosL